MVMDLTGCDDETVANYYRNKCNELHRRLSRIAGIVETVDHRAMFGDVVTPTLQEMTQEEMSKIYALSKGHGEDWVPRDTKGPNHGGSNGTD